MTMSSTNDEVQPHRLLDEPSYFIEHYLGEEPFDYQREFMDDSSQRKAAVCGRRVGKSTMASWLALWYSITHANAEILITAKAQRQSMELFNEVKKQIRQSEIDEDRWGITRDTRTEINFDNGSRIICLPVGTDGSNIRGYGTDLLVVDEAAFVADEIFQQVLSPMLAVGDSNFILLSTPFGKKGFLYERFRDETWHTLQIPTWENPMIDDEFIEEQRRNLTPTQFRQEIRGEFVESADSFFTRAELMNAASESVRRTDTQICYLGVDLASTGGDESVYVSIDGDGNVFDIEHTANRSMTDAMGRVRELDSYHDYATIMIDSTGLGTGVVDQIKEDLGRKVQGFKFTNEKKQSLYNTLKNQLQDGSVSYSFVPGKDEAENKMVDQCLQLEYEYTSTGRTKIHHPTGGHDDFSDALALAVWAKSQKNMARSDKGSMKPFNLGSLR
jgi:phage FluMu gp28-like protein